MKSTKNTKEEGFYEQINQHLIDLSFGPTVTEDAKLSKALKTSLKRMDDMIDGRPVEEVDLRIAYFTARDLIGEDISCLKKDDEKRLCFETALVMLYLRRPECEKLIIRTPQEFLKRFPEFHEIDDRAQLHVLLQWRNVMKVAMEVIPARNHKNHLLDIVTRITEGKHYKYITGSGQTLQTQRRVLIYEREGDIAPLPRPPRKGDVKGQKLQLNKPTLRKIKRKLEESQGNEEFCPLKQACCDISDTLEAPSSSSRAKPSSALSVGFDENAQATGVSAGVDPTIIETVPLKGEDDISTIPILDLNRTKSGPDNDIFLAPYKKFAEQTNSAVFVEAPLRDEFSSAYCLGPIQRDDSGERNMNMLLNTLMGMGGIENMSGPFENTGK